MPKTNTDYIQIRSFLLDNVSSIIETLNVKRKNKQNQSDDLFALDQGVEVAENINWNLHYQKRTKLDILQEEKNSLGLYVSGNPLEGYVDLLKFVKRQLKTKNIHLVLVEKVKKIFTRNNNMMLALQITNHIESLEGIIFSSKAIVFSSILQEKQIYWVYGNIKQKNKTETIEQENNNFDQVSKITINGICPFVEGPLQAIKSAEVENRNNSELLAKIDWKKIMEKPGLINKIISQTDDYQNLLKNQTGKKIKLKLRKILGGKALNYIKQKLSKQPLPEYLPVEIEAEISTNKFKKVKGDYWLHPRIVEKINQKTTQLNSNC